MEAVRVRLMTNKNVERASDEKEMRNPSRHIYQVRVHVRIAADDKVGAMNEVRYLFGGRIGAAVEVIGALDLTAGENPWPPLGESHR